MTCKCPKQTIAFSKYHIVPNTGYQPLPHKCCTQLSQHRKTDVFPWVSQDTPWRSQRSFHRFGMRGDGIFNGTTPFWYKVSMLLLQSQAKVVEAASRHWCSPFLFLFTSLFWTQEHTEGSCLRCYCCLDSVIGGILMWISAEKKFLFTIYSCSDVIIWSKVHIWLNNDWIVTIFPLKIWNYVHKVSSWGIKL